jgi:hypothetical protein
MPGTKPGQKEIRMVLDEGSETHETLLEWAQKRGLTPAKAARVIVTDWADALNGRPNPFALAIAAAAGANGVPGPGQIMQTPAPAPEQESAEEKARKAALLEAEEQFA